jgi:Cu/Ag efflux protein CusF
MKNSFCKITLSFLFTLLFAFASIVSASAQGRRPEFNPDKRVGGKLSAINGNTLTVTNREGETQTITVTAETKYFRNREAATLSSFQTDDFIAATGAKNASGQFVAEQVMGGDRPPRGPGGPGGRGDRGPRPQRDGMVGDYVSADASAKTITIKTRDGKEQLVYTSETTEVSRNREAASLSDFKAGDHVAAFGKLDSAGKYVAHRIVGGDAAPPRKR